MVARGDLGVEMGFAELAGLQKQIMQEARHQNRVVITATQMMESMITDTIPTRAEVSDVANAVMEGTDAVMLSAETAAGKHPAKVVEAMAQIIVGAEKYQVRARAHPPAQYRLFRARERGHRGGGHVHRESPARAGHRRAHRVRDRPRCGCRGCARTFRSMPSPGTRATRSRVTLYRGVYPVAYDVTDKDREAFYFSIFRQLLDLKLVQGGRSHHSHQGRAHAASPGGTNSMQILQVMRK